MICPGCKSLTVNRETLFTCDKDHEFTFVKKTGSWGYEPVKGGQIVIGRNDANYYYIIYKSDQFDIPEIEVQDCADYLNRFLKLKSFM